MTFCFQRPVEKDRYKTFYFVNYPDVNQNPTSCPRCIVRDVASFSVCPDTSSGNPGLPTFAPDVSVHPSVALPKNMYCFHYFGRTDGSRCNNLAQGIMCGTGSRCEEKKKASRNMNVFLST